MIKSLLLLAAFSMLSGPLFAKTVKVAVGLSLPPYVIQDSKSGMEFDVVKKVLEMSGHQMEAVFVPFARVVTLMEQGKVDAAMTVNPGSGIKANYSDSHITYQNFAITLKSKGFNISNVADLGKHSVAAFQNAKKYLGPDFASMSAANGKYREYPEQVAQNKLLYAGRVDVVVGDKNIFNHYNSQVKAMVDTSQEVVFHEVFPATPYSVAFKDKAIADAFNANLKKLKESGEYDKILNKYK